MKLPQHLFDRYIVGVIETAANILKSKVQLTRDSARTTRINLIYKQLQVYVK